MTSTEETTSFTREAEQVYFKVYLRLNLWILIRWTVLKYHDIIVCFFIKIVLTSTWASSPGASGDIALIKLKKPITYTRTGI